MRTTNLSTGRLKKQINDMLKYELLIRPAMEDSIIPADALLLHVAPFISNSIVYDKESIANVFKKDEYASKFINETERQIFTELLFALLNGNEGVSVTIPEEGLFRGVSLKELRISLKPGVTSLSEIIDDKLIQTTMEDRNVSSDCIISMAVLRYRDLISCILLLMLAIGALILEQNSASFVSPFTLGPAGLLPFNFLNSIFCLRSKEAVPGAQFFMKKEDEKKRTNLLAFHNKYTLAPEVVSGTNDFRNYSAPF